MAFYVLLYNDGLSKTSDIFKLRKQLISHQSALSFVGFVIFSQKSLVDFKSYFWCEKQSSSFEATTIDEFSRSSIVLVEETTYGSLIQPLFKFTFVVWFRLLFLVIDLQWLKQLPFLLSWLWGILIRDNNIKKCIFIISSQLVLNTLNMVHSILNLNRMKEARRAITLRFSCRDLNF